MRTDREKLAGTWDIVSLEVEGHAVGAAAFGGSQIVMEGDRFTTVSMGAEYCGTFTFDESAMPKTLDLLFTEGPHAGMVSPAIYELDDECLTICLGFAGRTRPEEFKTTPGSGHALETLRRAPESVSIEAAGQAGSDETPVHDASTPGAGPSAAPTAEGSGGADLAALQGKWSMVLGRMDGESLPEMFIATAKRVVRGTEVTVTFGGQVFLKASFSLDAGTTPKSMDYTLLAGPNQGRQQLGIYELNGDSLRICYAPPGSPRPTEFTAEIGEARTLGEWKRTG